MCLGLSRVRVLPGVLRVLGCIMITGAAWILYAAAVAAVQQAFR
jgi:hypothetical protein